MLLVAAAAGVVITLAPVLPPLLRDPLIVAVMVIWLAVAGSACIAVARAVRSDLSRRAKGSLLGLIAVFGTSIAILLAVQLELIRVVEHRPAFTWIVDWRWALNHAQAIARSGNVFASLDYVGVGLDYHVGPAWFAAATQRLFGTGMAHVLFGFVPLLCVVTMVIGGALLLRNMGISGRLAAAAVAVAMAWPVPASPPTWILHGFGSVLLAPYSWQYLATDLMLNSLLGLAVGLASLALLLDRRASPAGLAAGCVGLASCIGIKPQFFVGFGLVAGLLVCWRIVAEPLARGRNVRVLLAVLASLALAVLARATLPGDVALFDAPRFGHFPFDSFSTEVRRTYTLLAVVALAAWLIARRYRRTSDDEPRAGLLVVAGIVCLSLALVLHGIAVPVKAQYILQGQAIGLREMTATYLTRDLLQSLEPVRMILLAAAIALLGAVSMAVHPRARALFVACCAIVVLAPIPVAAAGFSHTPPEQYGVAEDAGLLEVLRATPIPGSILISSDIADPANDHSRPLRAPLLTAYQGHQFYVSNLRYVNYVRPDALERLTALREFFGAAWSPWHGAWLAKNGITHILVDSRCSPAWLDDPALPLTVLSRSADWTVFQVNPQAGKTALDGALPPSVWHDLVPKWGRADCLTGYLRDR